MESYPQLVALVILFPAIGAFLNFFWGARLGERWVGIIATGASSLAFVVALLLFSGLNAGAYTEAVINPPFFDGWIRLGGGAVEIPWQMRVDTLSVTMMLFVTGVGSLIHMYSLGYMHGDARFHRFMAYLNMFLAFMLILVTGNNMLMMFVGWEGVGVSSYLLIGFWWDKAKGVGWRNSSAARKAFIVNRVGDFGILMAVFLTFYTFGTLDFYRPGEFAVVPHGADSAEVAPTEGDASLLRVGYLNAETDEGASPRVNAFGTSDNDHIPTEQLGIFGQAERYFEEGGRIVDFGSFSLPFDTVITLITLFILIGATGKSAQIPLFIWLPDAMAGPTPVSALIHAATMVTAGVYLMVRCNVFFYEAPFTSFIVTLVGVGTAVAAGFMAIGQWDIKRVLAYSTVSQLGFMVAAVGVGAYSAAIFHMVTHAFFKALLFLGSGSVIHGVEHGHHHAAHHGHDDHGHDDHGDAHHDDDFDPQDMRNMGGLRARMPITYVTYVIGTLALAGIFPFAGFWSKDEILADSWIVGLFDGNLAGYIALPGLLLAAGFTAFYMWRQVVMVFHGTPRTEAAAKAPESAWVMTVPLIVLAFFSVTIGFMNTPSGVLGLDNIFGAHLFTDWLELSVLHAHAADFQLLLALIALGLAITAIILAGRIYGGDKMRLMGRQDPLEMQPAIARGFRLANARLYWDETYNRFIERPFNATSKFLADRLDWAFWHDYVHDTVIGKGFNAVGTFLSKPIDTGIIDGTVNGIGRLVRWIGGGLRQVQTGYVRVSAITLLVGVVVVIIVLLLPLLRTGA